MQTVESLKLLPVWVDPEHLVASARILLQGHAMRVLGVVDNGELIGTVSIERVLSESGFVPVRTITDSIRLIVQATDATREVAQRFVEHDLDFAPVVKDGRFLGIVTANMLLRELGRSWDPLTGLSWSDRLREWGIENLKRGNEVTILFFDINQFGTYNKRFGHIVGDKILREMAGFLRDRVNPDTDVLVRFGGDEFAIGTLRTRGEAEEMVQEIGRSGHEISVPDAGEGVTFSVGIFGGKRTKERESVHFAATLDNLINLASKDCLSRKPDLSIRPELTLPSAPEIEIAPEVPEVRVVNVFADESSPTALTQVILRHGDQVISGVSARMGRPTIQSVATATGKALERAFPGATFKVGDINLTESKDGGRLVSVAGQFSQGERIALTGGVGSVGDDLYASVAEATVQAFLSAGPTH
jgi:IMP dehydrogenase